jgi:hypothetical protein
MKSLLYTIAICVVAYSCTSRTTKSDKLTPELATDLINTHYQGQVVYETFPLTQGGAFTEAVREKFVELRNAGLITFTEEPDADGTSTFTATLTPKGTQYVIEDRGQEVIVKHADMSLSNIRSITPTPDGQSALVKYTLKSYNITPFGVLNGSQEETMESEDNFVRSGDEWRLQSNSTPRRFN